MIKDRILIIKFPFDKNIYTTNESSQNSEDSFVAFHTFDKKSKKIFKGELIKISEKKIKETNITVEKLEPFTYNIQNKEEYIKNIENVVNIIKEKKIPKVVISRQKRVDFPKGETIDLGKTFLNICRDYSNAFVYLFVDEKEAWLGATPEILGKYDKNNNSFETMSLAGTIPVSESWSNKEIEEQKPVSQYIHSILNALSGTEKLYKSPTYDYISGNIKHLCNDFKIKITGEKIPKLIDTLHPTPAVCGIPKEICIKIIKNTEKHDRKLYSGYIHVENSRASSYYVNLRCAQIYKNGIILYAGGGITEGSQAEKEWLETELKMDTIFKRLVISKL